MTVLMCFYVQPERHGMDYDNQEEKDEQFDRIKKFVKEYKDHPALLGWSIGNELNLSYTNPRVYDEVNRISKWIHEEDPNHLTTTTLSSFNADVVKEVKERASDLDFLSIQLYGDLFALEDMLKKAEWTGPYMVTEWGTIGHWEMEFTEWGAPIEQTSTEKAATYLRGYNKSIAPFGDQCIGNYVFLWGQKQERTPTWYGLFLESGHETEPIDVLHYIWHNEWPENRTPQISEITLDDKGSRDNIYLEPNQSYKAAASMNDPEHDELSYKWVIMKESMEKKIGGDHEEVPEQLFSSEGPSAEINIQTPAQEGPYRLFIYADDGNGHAAHANIPFFVKS